MFKKSGTLILQNSDENTKSAEFGTSSNFDNIDKINTKSNNQAKESKESGDHLSNFIANNNSKESSDFGSGGLSVSYPEVADNTNEQVQHSLATQAVDELFLIVTTLCCIIETFFQPFYPKEVTYDLHTDLMSLSQHLLFKHQENSRIYECISVLMRVDTQFDDKDMREKMRLCKEYGPLDFGIEAEFCKP